MHEYCTCTKFISRSVHNVVAETRLCLEHLIVTGKLKDLKGGMYLIDWPPSQLVRELG